MNVDCWNSTAAAAAVAILQDDAAWLSALSREDRDHAYAKPPGAASLQSSIELAERAAALYFAVRVLRRIENALGGRERADYLKAYFDALYGPLPVATAAAAQAP